MNQPFLHALNTLLDKELIGTLLLFSQQDFTQQLQRAERSVHYATPAEQEQMSRSADFAVLADCLEHMSKKEGMALIARLRDVQTRRVLVDVACSSASVWEQIDFIGLGFQCVARYELDGTAHEVYAFDLRHYKPAPDWLNATFWANPELWDKFRW